MIDFALVHEHALENITLLCARHHTEVTNKLLPTEDIYKYNNRPFNVVNSKTSPYLLHYGTATCDFVIGGNVFRNDTNIEYFHAIRIDDDTILGFRRENGTILTTFIYYDENDRTVLEITDNELRFSTDLWDVEFVGRRLKIRRQSGDVISEIFFEPPSRITVERAKINHNGIGLLVVGTSLLVLNGAVGFLNLEVSDYPVGLGLGNISTQCGLAIQVGDEKRHQYISRSEVRRWLRARKTRRR
jgi:hypothetical protein